MKVLIPLAASVLMFSNPAAASQLETAMNRVVANYVARLEIGQNNWAKPDSFEGASYQEASNRMNDPDYDPRDPANAWGGHDGGNDDRGGRGESDHGGNGESDHGGNGEGDHGGNGESDHGGNGEGDHGGNGEGDHGGNGEGDHGGNGEGDHSGDGEGDHGGNGEGDHGGDGEGDHGGDD
ncbi:hypothetical protein TG4357_03491 [Thalassovita gelatinovora]|uniref:Uncharacterized protein n=1 Tax=Thalassovita gelatinovora TaxID=53501 RepID=A0A0P1FJR4_THAGE|nr:hypothetical protein [Thalassovita gelatinovora]QIZ81717.1 hypothetical protein HFZ77_15155 [Thalassovita gelatinovora]CUH68285.1 hypothetical protein TG4357_03491 [Thalassovita gelatinovora]SEQ32661.1 hypothetical protein SAMN04488043_104363 [Thalassovita gelatinovora]